jgi:histidyl-tRNA synthetase
LSDASKAHFERVRHLLERANLPFVVDGNLVRGFDYYTGVVWEVTAGGLGAQNAVGGGGRYDNLVATLGGRPTPGVGFGCGIERLLIALEAQNAELPVDRRPLVWLVSQNDAARDFNWSLLQELRAAGIRADMDPSGRSVKSQFKLADREKAAWCVVVGDQELASGSVMLKNLKTTEQSPVKREELLAKLAASPA